MAEGERELIRFEKDGDIGVITVDNPPVNALSVGVPEGIVAAVDKGNADPAVTAMMLIGAGRSFERRFRPEFQPHTLRHSDRLGNRGIQTDLLRHAECIPAEAHRPVEGECIAVVIGAGQRIHG